MNGKMLSKLKKMFPEKHVIIVTKKSKIKISFEKIFMALEILNSAPSNCLPQNSCHNSITVAKDGFDKELKKALKTNFSYAKYISEILVNRKICEEFHKINNTGRKLKYTKLLSEWTW